MAQYGEEMLQFENPDNSVHSAQCLTDTTPTHGLQLRHHQLQLLLRLALVVLMYHNNDDVTIQDLLCGFCLHCSSLCWNLVRVVFYDVSKCLLAEVIIWSEEKLRLVHDIVLVVIAQEVCGVS